MQEQDASKVCSTALTACCETSFDRLIDTIGVPVAEAVLERRLRHRSW